MQVMVSRERLRLRGSWYFRNIGRFLMEETWAEHMEVAALQIYLETVTSKPQPLWIACGMMLCRC